MAPPSWATDEPDQRKIENFIIIPEVAMASLAAISARPDNKLSSLGWTASVSQRLWSVNIESYGETEEVRLEINGFSWGSASTSSIVTFTGTGSVGSEPLLIHGRIRWEKAKVKGDLDSMVFEQTTKIGKNSLWSWVIGTEIVGCGLAGGITANTVAGGLTSGLSLPLAASIYVTGATAGADVCLSISSAIRETLNSNKPPLPPEAPKVPEIEPSKPLANEIIVVANANGRLSGRFPLGRNDDHINLDGSMFWSDGFAKGVVRIEKER